MNIMPILKHQIGPMIRRERQARGLRLEDVATEAGISIAGLSNIEKSVKNTTVDTLDRIFGALGIEPLLQLDFSKEEAELVDLAQRCSPEVLQVAKNIMAQSAALEEGTKRFA